MATYEPTSSNQLASILSTVVSPTTEQTILNTLASLGLTPAPGAPLPLDLVVATTNEFVTVPDDDLLFVVTNPTTGNVSVEFSGPDGLTVILGDGNVNLVDLSDATIFGGSGSDVVKVTAGNNSLVAGTGDNTLKGGSGNDTITAAAAAGNDKLVAGSGNATLYGGSGNDTLKGGQNMSASMVAGTGNTTIKGGALATSHDKLIAGSGNDWLQSRAGDDTLLGSTIAGSLTTMVGGSGDDKFKGRASNASIVAGTGNDTIKAGTGDNSVYLFGGGQDVVKGGAGHSTVWAGTTGDDTINSGAGPMSVISSQASTSIAGEATIASGLHAGYTEILFQGGQILTAKGVTIDFTDGGTKAT